MDKTTISFEDLLQKAVISLHTKEQDILPSEKELKNQLSFSPAFYRKMKRLLHKRFFPQPPHAPVCKTHSRYFTRILVVAAILLAASVTAAAVFGLPELLHMLFEEKAALALPFAKPLHGVFELSKPLSTLPDAVQETPKIELKAAVADNSVLYIIYSVKDSTGQPLQGTYDFTNILFNIDLPEALPNSGYTYGPIVSDTPTQELLFLLRADCDATCIGKTAHLTLQNLKKQEDLDIKTAPLDFAALSKEGYIAEECQTVKKQSKQELEAFYDKIDHKTREEIDQMVNDQLEHQLWDCTKNAIISLVMKMPSNHYHINVSSCFDKGKNSVQNATESQKCPR